MQERLGEKLKHKVEDVVHKVEDVVHNVEHKVEDVVHNVEHRCGFRDQPSQAPHCLAQGTHVPHLDPSH